MLALRTSKKLKAIRQRAKLSQVELAKRMDISGSYITRLEKGQILPSLHFAFKLEHTLGLQAELSTLILQAEYERATGADGHSLPTLSFSEPVKRNEKGVALVPLFIRAPRAFKGHNFKIADSKGLYPIPSDLIKGQGIYLTAVPDMSMDSARLFEEELVVVTAEAEPRSGDIVVVGKEGGDIQIRRYFIQKARVLLSPATQRAGFTPEMLPVTTFRGLFRGVVAYKYLTALKRA